MNTLQWIRKYGLHLKKSFGQNFLNSEETVQKIVDTALIKQDETVIEIGPGAGTMTEKLAASGANIIAYEADLSLKELLTERFCSYKNVQILFEDFLRADLAVHPPKVKYVANIPYNISSPILQKIFSSGLVFEKAVLMVQKEFGERMAAVQGKEYSPLSIFVQYYCTVKEEFIVPRTEFIPSP
ncbi:MAG TPA: 16S rRNA (adenine(1518)-N(6)/adenine(1519)-N(6))-dimethyltransferase RsmA, partial [Petrotogaceae bacterium]|nr:16S rRNA (adenine(1518)-N(6)/adenine(1519)-N(6))-dimethyltransferase RsmA [Petrotogaceae bacterium]